MKFIPIKANNPGFAILVFIMLSIHSCRGALGLSSQFAIIIGHSQV